MVRIASFNVENLFARPKAFDTTDWSKGKKALTNIADSFTEEEQKLIGRTVVEDTDFDLDARVERRRYFVHRVKVVGDQAVEVRAPAQQARVARQPPAKHAGDRDHLRVAALRCA